MDPTNKILSDIRERTARVETKIDHLTEVHETAGTAKTTAEKAMASTRSAHKRIDKIDKVIYWLSTTVIGAVIIAVLTLVIKGGA